MDISPARNHDLIPNPYVVGRPLMKASESLFIGRRDVFAWFEENLVGAGQSNALTLYGRRRIGKTSTLYQLTEGERGRVLRERPKRPVRAAYIDLQRFAGRPTDEFLRGLATALCRRVDSSGDVHNEREVAGESAYAAFDRRLDRLEQSVSPDILILVAIDEFEQIKSGIEAGILDPDVIPFLRSQIQHRHRFAFLISGALGLLDPFWSAIVNLTARYELGMLDYEDTERLIVEPVAGKLQYEDAAVESIWRQTAGHPFLVQAICHRLVRSINRRPVRKRIHLADVERAIDELGKEGFPGDWLGGDLSGWSFRLPTTAIEVSPS